MKLLNKTATLTLALSTLYAISPSQAGPVTIPNTFNAGETAVAADVNDNFTAVKAAVDDNDAAITFNSGDISLNTNDITTLGSRLTSSYWVSVNPNSFVSENSTQGQSTFCSLNYRSDNPRVGFHNNAGASSADCDMIGGIQLPDNNTILSIRCGQLPGNASAEVSLKRARQVGSPSLEVITTAPAPALFGGHVASTSSSIQSGTEIVNNQNYSYFFYVDIDASDFSAVNWGFTGCSVEVQPNAL